MANEGDIRPRSVSTIRLGRVVAPQLKFDQAPSQRLLESKLPILLDATDLAEAFSIDRSRLQWLCYQSSKAGVTHYNTFTIPKRDGGQRVISSPKAQLRLAQDWIRFNILKHLAPHSRVATAFRPGLSILDNAQAHCKKAIVIRIDLKDFFPSITYRRVKGVFQSAGYSEGVAAMLAILCTQPPPLGGQNAVISDSQRLNSRSLPQGACTSPDLANYLCRKMDFRIEAFAKSLGFSYTRYADDLVFSHKQKRGKIDILTSVVYQILREEGFEPNLNKTMIMRHNSRQVVTGLVVNKHPKISRRDLKRFRAIAHQYHTLGHEHVTNNLGKDAKQFLLGYISYAKMINEQQAKRLTSLLRF